MAEIKHTPGPDEMTEDAIRTRAKALLFKNGWRPGEKFSAHSVVELMVSLGMDLTRDPELARCAHPECGCDSDAICSAATAKAEGQANG